jgi:P pilus assembly chaperone PapD
MLNKAPFIITPPLYRLDGGQKNIERIVMTGVAAG